MSCNREENRKERQMLIVVGKQLLQVRKEAGKLETKPIALQTKTRKKNIQTAYAMVYRKDEDPIVIYAPKSPIENVGEEKQYKVKGLV